MAGSDASCKVCGQSLDAIERIVAYHEEGVYVCRTCCNSICAKAGIRPFEKYRTWKLLLKLFFGIMFICSSVYDETGGAAVASVAIGAGLIAWGVVPLVLEKSRCDSVVASTLRERTKTRSMRRICAHCGGVSSGNYCEYCGSPFET